MKTYRVLKCFGVNGSIYITPAHEPIIGRLLTEEQIADNVATGHLRVEETQDEVALPSEE